MERQIGEIFDYEGKKLQVVEQKRCKGCIFFNRYNIFCMNMQDEITGMCCERTDGKSVIFKEL